MKQFNLRDGSSFTGVLLGQKGNQSQFIMVTDKGNKVLLTLNNKSLQWNG